jgi:transcriptional regulator with XRE-family HTH domain
MTVKLEHMQRTAEHLPPQWPSPANPGDLSKRIARRRAELRLSVAQVAARSLVSTRYLEYLERYPAMPRPATLRALAAALRTTPAALLGAGGQAPPGRTPLAGSPTFESLTPAECRRLIEPGGIGRIAVATASGLMVLPVNYVMVANTIVLRTGSGTLIAAHAADDVTFEVDHIDEALGQGWSVLVRGPAHRVAQPGELRHLREHAALIPWAGGEREVYVRIVPVHVSGRRVGI